MPSDVSDDTFPTESAILEPDSPKNAGGGNPDKEGGALVIPAKAKVGKKKIDETGVSVGGAPRNPAKGKRRAEKGTARRKMAAQAEELGKTGKGSGIPDNHSQVQNPP